MIPAFDATAQQAAELEAMRRMLMASRGSFSLSIAVCNSPALRDYLIRRLQETFPGVTIVRLTADAADPFGFITSQLRSQQPETLFIINMERIIHATANEQRALRSLNASRELWARRFQCPVVLWLPEYAAAVLSTHARDFWRFRSHRFEFTSEFTTAAAGVSDRMSGDLTAASNLSQDEKHFRIAELEQRLSEAGDSPEPELVVHALNWLNELVLLHRDLGRLDDAERVWKKMEALAKRADNDEALASAYGNLGLIMETRGELDGAERMHRKSLEINEKLGRFEGIASSYNNLAIIMQDRGDLGEAERMLRKAMEIFKQLGHQEYMAGIFGNLGRIMQTHGRLDEAERMFRKSLEIDEKLGRLEGMAISYGNLGNIMRIRGDLDGAEQMHRRSLEIDEKLGRLEGIAGQYGNLGAIAAQRGDISAARVFGTKSRDLFTKLGAQHEAERVQAFLNELPEQVGP